MQRMLHTFVTKITPAQSMKMFTAPKSSKRSWTEHYLYLVAVGEMCGGANSWSKTTVYTMQIQTCECQCCPD